MNDIKRHSPVAFPIRPAKSAIRDHWVVALTYDNEGSGPWLVDLSHKTRWDLQDRHLDDLTPAGLAVPPVPGSCRLENRILVNRMNRTQAAVWHLGNEDSPVLPTESGYTDVSEASVFLALFGPRVFSITEKLTALDFIGPDRQPPFLLQGPFSHTPCQIVTLARASDGTGGILIACSRGYAGDMVHAIATAGAAHGLCPAGENRFTSWLVALQAKTAT